MTAIRRGRPRIGDAPVESIRLYARIPSRVMLQIESKIGRTPAALREALSAAVQTPKADRVLAYAPADATERDFSVTLTVNVPRDLAEQLREIYGTGSPGLVRAFATVLVAHEKAVTNA
jgi:hypothetical protein